MHCYKFYVVRWGCCSVKVGNRFPSKKHFVSWLGLSPKSKQSGSVKKKVYLKFQPCRTNLPTVGQSLLAGKSCAVGVFMRRLKSGKRG
ncbi:MAG: IS110 family transposase [Prevotellaceae bacterium]|nr:IS110 family transposase [Prevotellaceae bacterium]